MINKRLALLIALVTLAGMPARAQQPELLSGTRARTDSMPASEYFTISSRVLGENRLVNVYLPKAYREQSSLRLPVLYMPDGGVDEDFAHVTRTVDSLIALRAIRPVMVVGIPNTERRRDLTGPTRIASDSAIAKRVGGSAAFREFIRSELIPEVTERYRVTGERGIMGESLAGLFVVETLLLEPDLFRHYIAFDPSLWWNGGVLVDSAAVRVRAMGSTRRTVFLGSSDVKEIAEPTRRLSDVLRDAAGVDATHEAYTELTHATIFRALEARAIVRAFR